MFIIVRAVFSSMAGKTIYEVVWVAECSLVDAINKLHALRKANKKDEYILSVAFDK